MSVYYHVCDYNKAQRRFKVSVWKGFTMELQMHSPDKTEAVHTLILFKVEANSGVAKDGALRFSWSSGAHSALLIAYRVQRANYTSQKVNSETTLKLESPH